MTIRSFKQLFSTVFAVVLGGLLMALGLNIRGWVYGANFHDRLPQAFRDLVFNSTYNSFLIIAFFILGVLIGTIFGPRLAQSVINTGAVFERMSTREKIAVAMGLLLGVITSLPFFLLLLQIPMLGLPSAILILFASIYLGVRGMMSIKDEFKFVNTVSFEHPSQNADIGMERFKILDTNVIIDGRISDVCRTGFVTGPIYIPGFVLDELQHIADSSDSLKRARGRRGLDILNVMQKELPLIVRSYDHLIENTGGPVEEVDARLVLLAKEMNGDIVTNDFNLNKVAALQGVTVLNVNELANALKPVVLPGEEMPVTIIKEGKEQYQGVAYLDDGTMVVIEDGRKHIGEHMNVVVTSVLQTVAGKMIFAKIQVEEEEEDNDGGSRNSGGRTRFKIR